jgi:hypothetical protein
VVRLADKIDALIHELQQLKEQIGFSEADGQATAVSTEAPLYGLSPDSGFHVLAKHWHRVQYQQEQCQALLQADGLKRAIDATAQAAPQRNIAQGFRLLGASGRISPDQIDFSTERGLEAAVAHRWPIAATDASDHLPWRAIVGYQIPLFDEAAKNGWGAIDLLGVDHDLRPIVMELKKAGNREPPLRPLLEAAAYAVALRKSWKILCDELINILDGEEEWNERIKRLDSSPPSDIPIVIVAPEEYWSHWKKRDCSFRHAITSFQELITSFGKSGYPVSLVCLKLDEASKTIQGAHVTTFE